MSVLMTIPSCSPWYFVGIISLFPTSDVLASGCCFWSTLVVVGITLANFAAELLAYTHWSLRLVSLLLVGGGLFFQVRL